MTKMTLSNKTICTIGGGSGMPVINKALLGLNSWKIFSIVTTFDSGGDAGRIRTDERGKILAISDYWRSLISLWQDGEQKEIWEEILLFRDGRKRNFGNAFFSFLQEKAGNLGETKDLFNRLTNAEIKNEVIPVSSAFADICFTTQSKRVYKGEHQLDLLRMSSDLVTKAWLEPKIKANSKAIKAIKEANVIVVCPGSIYGSIVANFLPDGVKQAYQASKAFKILVSNIVSSANENKTNSLNDYFDIFADNLGIKNPFDLVIYPDFSKLNQKKLKKSLQLYKLENSFLVKDKLSKKSKIKPKIVKEDILKIEESNLRLRHSPKKLLSVFSKLLSDK